MKCKIKTAEKSVGIAFYVTEGGDCGAAGVVTPNVILPQMPLSFMAKCQSENVVHFCRNSLTVGVKRPSAI